MPPSGDAPDSTDSVVISAPIVVEDNFHFSHYYWNLWNLSTDSDVENDSDDEQILKPKQMKNEDIKLKVYNQVMGNKNNNIHFGKWDGIPIEEKDAYGRASEAMTDYMIGLALDMQPHRRKANDLKFVDLGSGTGAAVVQILERADPHLVVQATCLNMCHEQNITAKAMVEEKKFENQVEIIEGTFENAPFEESVFDLVFSQDSFIHSVSKKQTYSEAYRIAKPGGAFVFCDLMAGDNPDLTPAEEQKFVETNVLNDWLNPSQNVQTVKEAGWKDVELVDLTADMRISFQLMFKKVNFSLEHKQFGSNRNRVVLMNYSKKIKERIKQIDQGIFKWCVIHAKKPVKIDFLCKTPVPFVNTSKLILEKDDEENKTSIVVVDIVTKMPREKIMQLPSSIKLLITMSAGLDHITSGASKGQGIAIHHSGRDAITQHVAQYEMALIVLTLRDAYNQLKVPFPSFGWNLNWNCEGIPATDAKIAVIGMGLIGQALVKQVRAVAPNTNIMYHVPAIFRDVDVEQEYKLNYFSDIKQMAAECDILVPMCPLNKHTKHIVSREVLAMLKPSASLLNIARGGVVDTDALVEALENRSIKCAVLDTTFPEPLPKDHKLWTLDNCYIFPHFATNTVAVRKALVEDIQSIVEEFYGLGHSDKKLRQFEKELRYDLAVAHRLTAKYNMDMLVWNHISARFKNGCLVTPGRMLWSQIRPRDLVFSSSNVTADIIHDAIYAAHRDIGAIIHLHTPAALAVSCLQEGFVPLTQDAAYFYKKVATYEWDGVSDDNSEGPKITAAVQSLPGCNVLLMQNHGFVCLGKTIREVWVLAYYFERCCEVQLRVMQTGAKISIPSEQVMAKAAEASYLPDFAPGVCEWDALCEEIGTMEVREQETNMLRMRRNEFSFVTNF